ncbi:type II toxin-antitoxin system antitoxin SocA domain-containing protein [Corynebacterium sp. Q4381]|uniref:Panacea domain-containing protein n=1 Tax=Corynebacterium sp. Marseille-Q4381 TaxID=3121597 RepID=UPI002FE64633
MAYSPRVVANNILARAFEEKRLITPMKLQKILYFVTSQYSKKTEGDYLLEAPFETWAYGPVEYTVFDEFRTFSKKPITKYARDAAGNTLVVNESEDPYLREALDEVWEATRDKGAVFLSKLTHSEDSAWDKAYQNDCGVLDPHDIFEDDTYQDALGL